jgi:hypothetical protein
MAWMARIRPGQDGELGAGGILPAGTDGIATNYHPNWNVAPVWP